MLGSGGGSAVHTGQWEEGSSRHDAQVGEEELGCVLWGCLANGAELTFSVGIVM